MYIMLSISCPSEDRITSVVGGAFVEPEAASVSRSRVPAERVGVKQASSCGGVRCGTHAARGGAWACAWGVGGSEETNIRDKHSKSLEATSHETKVAWRAVGAAVSREEHYGMTGKILPSARAARCPPSTHAWSSDPSHQAPEESYIQRGVTLSAHARTGVIRPY
jgi:hypothetical protein